MDVSEIKGICLTKCPKEANDKLAQGWEMLHISNNFGQLSFYLVRK
ncbi:hypothetical protein [Brevibacillus borstelensis]